MRLPRAATLARAAEILSPLVLVWWGVALYDPRAAPVVVGAILWHRYLCDVKRGTR